MYFLLLHHGVPVPAENLNRTADDSSSARSQANSKPTGAYMPDGVDMQPLIRSEFHSNRFQYCPLRGIPDRFPDRLAATRNDRNDTVWASSPPARQS